jgi:D-glycero-alpha-D-manno-heptose-7-phosphate kinase
MLVTQSPLRVSLVGGPTDLPQYSNQYGGEILGFAIDKYLFVWLKERFDRKIIVNWSQNEVVSEISEIRHELVREAAKLSGLTHGFEVITTADIPSEGSGLGSSSALTVGLLNAFFSFKGYQVSTMELARMACEIEIKILGKPIGRQDQYISALGGIHHISFHKDGSVTFEPVRVAPETLRRLNQNLLLYYTGTTRQSSDILAGQINTISENIDSYHGMKKLVSPMREALEQGRVDDVGPLLNEAWQCKKKLARGVTQSKIDAMYETALKGGATGGKICGAGGGGFLLLYCPGSKQDALRLQMNGYAEMPFQIEQDGAKTLFNVRRPMWKTLG